MQETATLAGGCFWCHDAIFRRTRGVISSTVGFSGGHVPHPTYEQIHAEDTGHAEAVQVVFDPTVISYETLLQVFWATHDPTTPNRDGANIGPEYRSEIFYHDEAQHQTALQVLENFAQNLWDKPIVTQITPFTSFYPADDYHQDYYGKNPQAAYCQVIINPKLSKFQESFSAWLV